MGRGWEWVRGAAAGTAANTTAAAHTTPARQLPLSLQWGGRKGPEIDLR